MRAWFLFFAFFFGQNMLKWAIISRVYVWQIQHTKLCTIFVLTFKHTFPDLFMSFEVSGQHTRMTYNKWWWKKRKKNCRNENANSPGQIDISFGCCFFGWIQQKTAAASVWLAILPIGRVNGDCAFFVRVYENVYVFSFHFFRFFCFSFGRLFIRTRDFFFNAIQCK